MEKILQFKFLEIQFDENNVQHNKYEYIGTSNVILQECDHTMVEYTNEQLDKIKSDGFILI